MDKIELMTRRIEQGYYFPVALAGWDIRKPEGAKLYRAEGSRLHEQFNTDALDALGLSDHPKGKELMRLAWDYGHANGYSEVWLIAQELAQLLKDENGK